MRVFTVFKIRGKNAVARAQGRCSPAPGYGLVAFKRKSNPKCVHEKGHQETEVTSKVNK